MEETIQPQLTKEDSKTFVINEYEKILQQLTLECNNQAS